MENTETLKEKPDGSESETPKNPEEERDAASP
jgi:hypothetical protein